MRSVYSLDSISTRTKLPSSAARRTSCSTLARHCVEGEVEPELGEFQGNVALNAGIVNGVEGAQVDVARFGGFGERGDAFAEVVERNRDAFGVEFAANGKGLIESFTSDEPGGEPLGQRRGFHPLP